MAPAIIHDYLYWEQSCTKDEADAVMYLAMLEVGLSTFKIDLIYVGVRTEAALEAWNNNTTARIQGEPRFLTERYVNIIQDSQINPDATLASIQQQAVEQQGTYEPVLPNAKIKSACEVALTKFKTLE